MNIKGEKGSKNCWYFGYVLIKRNCVEVQRWSYWCKKFGVRKASKLLKNQQIVKVGGIYTNPGESYNVKRLLKKIKNRR